jgi:hypothetical protein
MTNDGSVPPADRLGYQEASARLRSFKRLYRWASDAIREFQQEGGVAFKASYEDSVLTPQLTMSNEAAVIRFAVIVRRFLDPSDALDVRAMLAWIRSRYDDGALSEQDAVDLLRVMDRITEGQIGIMVNDQQPTAEQVYETVARGAFFGADQQ